MMRGCACAVPVAMALVTGALLLVAWLAPTAVDWVAGS